MFRAKKGGKKDPFGKMEPCFKIATPEVFSFLEKPTVAAGSIPGPEEIVAVDFWDGRNPEFRESLIQKWVLNNSLNKHIEIHHKE